MTITNTADFRAAYPRISDEVEAALVSKSLYDAENFFVKPRLGNAKYTDILQNPQNYHTEIEGGIKTANGEDLHLAGLKNAIYSIAYGNLLMETLNATSFGTVRKKDDYSAQADYGDILRLAEMHWNTGKAYLKELTDLWQINDNGNHPDYFNEYV